MAEEERIEIPYVLESILRYCLKEAQKRLEDGEELIPFSALAAGETLFCEEHNFDTPEETFADVRHTVEHARGSQGYGICYDGFIETPAGNRDALIAQGGVPGGEYGHAIGVLYRVDSDGNYVFEEEPIYIGKALNYMSWLGMDDEDESEGEGAESATADAAADAEAELQEDSAE